VERFSATIAGCLMALVVQVCTDAVLKKLRPRSPEIKASVS
jgi:hypothetical protein